MTTVMFYEMNFLPGVIFEQFMLLLPKCTILLLLKPTDLNRHLNFLELFLGSMNVIVHVVGQESDHELAGRSSSNKLQINFFDGKY